MPRQEHEATVPATLRVHGLNRIVKLCSVDPMRRVLESRRVEYQRFLILLAESADWAEVAIAGLS